jgi:hypothetical protein
MKSRNITRVALLCLLGILFARPADAAPGDTVITVSYKVRAVRVKPQPLSGIGENTLRAVLHADGTVDDVIDAKGGKSSKKWEAKDRKLGGRKDFAAQWRVIDANTLERKFEDATHDYVVKVAVDGKKCKAKVGYILKPGQTEYRTHSVQLNQIAYYSTLKAFDVRCRIE